MVSREVHEAHLDVSDLNVLLNDGREEVPNPPAPLFQALACLPDPGVDVSVTIGTDAPPKLFHFCVKRSK